MTTTRMMMITVIKIPAGRHLVLFRQHGWLAKRGRWLFSFKSLLIDRYYSNAMLKKTSQVMFWNVSPSLTLRMSPSPQVGLAHLTAMEKPGENHSKCKNWAGTKTWHTNFLFNLLWLMVMSFRWGLPGIGYLVRGENRPRLIEVQGSRSPAPSP